MLVYDVISFFHSWLEIRQIHGVFFEVLDLHFSLLFHLLPVDANGEILEVLWVVTFALMLVESLLADIILVPLLHLTPDIKHEHGLVIFVP